MGKPRKLKKAALVAAAAVVLIAAVLYFGLGRYLIGRAFERVEQRTGVRIEYGDLDMGFGTITLKDLEVFLPDESEPFARAKSTEADLFERTAHMDYLLIERGGVTAAAKGDVHLGRVAFSFRASIPPSPCAQAFAAVPARFRSSLEQVELAGQFALEVHAVFDENKPKSSVLDIDFDNGCKIVEFGQLPRPDLFRKPFSTVAYNEKKEPYELKTGPGTDGWTSFGSMPRHLVDAVIEAEDSTFYKHRGVLLHRIKTAFESNLKRGKAQYGASTITMQLAKNLFLSREKTLERKLQELFFVWYLESSFTKDEIIELYLNVAEFGPSLYGVRAAARHYFGREPRELDLLESVFLAKLMPSPVKRHQAFENDKIPRDQMGRIRRLLGKLRDRMRISEEAYEQALDSKVRFHHPGDPDPAQDAGPPQDAGLSDDPKDEPAVKRPLFRASRPKLSRKPPPLDRLVGERKSRGALLTASD